jgi:hypothetical protein
MEKNVDVSLLPAIKSVASLFAICREPKTGPLRRIKYMITNTGDQVRTVIEMSDIPMIEFDQGMFKLHHDGDQRSKIRLY